ncbi:MAG: hypothetical protein WC575_00330 [Patescibacteria group bacterium]
MNIIIVTLNTASVALLKQIQGIHNIRIAQSYNQALSVFDQIRLEKEASNLSEKDYIMLTEFDIPLANGCDSQPLNCITLCKEAAKRHYPLIIVGLRPHSCNHETIALVNSLGKQEPNQWYITKQEMQTANELSTIVYFVKLPILTHGVDETLLRPEAYDWPAIITTVKKNIAKENINA